MLFLSKGTALQKTNIMNWNYAFVKLQHLIILWKTRQIKRWNPCPIYILTEFVMIDMITATNSYRRRSAITIWFNHACSATLKIQYKGHRVVTCFQTQRGLNESFHTKLELEKNTRLWRDTCFKRMQRPTDKFEFNQVDDRSIQDKKFRPKNLKTRTKW